MCPICDSQDVTPAGELNSYPIGRCKNCGHLFCLRMPTNRVLGELYARYSYETNHLANIPEFVLQSLADLMRSLAKYRRSNRLLDVGFGAGTILVAARREGWDVHGIEKSGLAAEQAQAAGFADAREGDFLESPYEEASFDVVTLAGVVEHLVNPQPFLHRARRLLRTGGLLFVSTPNSRSLSAHALGLDWSVVSPPEHVNLFSTTSLTMALRDAGFEQPVIRTEGFNPYEVATRWRRRTRTAVSEEAASRRIESTDTSVDPAPGTDSTPAGAMSRVESAYALNALLMRSAAGRCVKRLTNNALTLARVGDELKVWAPAT